MSTRMLIPHEHGAWAQLGMPMVTTLIIVPNRLAAGLLAGSIIAVFLAFEPFAVVIGKRGARIQREDGARARLRLVQLGFLGAFLFLGWLYDNLESLELLVTFVPGLVLGALFALSFWKFGERALTSEVFGGVALAATTWPLARTGGLDSAQSVAMTLVWCLGFLAIDVAVDRCIKRPKDQQGPMMRWGFVFGGALVGLGIYYRQATAYAPFAVALTPLLFAALALALRPPPVKAIKTVGWTLALSSTATSVALIWFLLK